MIQILSKQQAPLPIKPWTGIVDATKDGLICPQPSMLMQSEDCLHLNVYTKKVCIFT